MKNKLGSAVCKVAIAACLISQCASANIPASQRQALINLYNTTHGDTWIENDGWKTNGAFSPAGTEESWEGVLVINDVVFKLNLSSNNLTGPFPDLSALTGLTFINFSNNHLTGSVPSFAPYPLLQTFIASNNQLSGVLPADLSNALELTAFVVSGNSLSNTLGSPIPIYFDIPNLTKLTKLYNFDIGSNNFVGPLPDISALTALQYFDAHNNPLTGPLPDIAQLSALINFDVSNASPGQSTLTGSLPSFNKLTQLFEFRVANNMLSGTVQALPLSIGVFDVSTNQFRGSLPTLTGLPKLVSFFAKNNRFTGSLPDVSTATSLSHLEVQFNRLTGVLPGLPGHSMTDTSGAGFTALCPNLLSTPPSASSNFDAQWNIAVNADATVPWWNATMSPTFACDRDTIFKDLFDNL